MVANADPKNGSFAGAWGKLGCPTPTRGIAAYTISPNRQNPFAGAGHAATFNVFRRFRHQVLYVAPPFIVAYAAMSWAVEKNEFLNSKAGRIIGDAE
ncbi:Cytochrome b-c1 complex subunit 8 [Talaromyces atroroseus]|uniref:Cytochrome b-c1 complex subunit 8 n=1 Tax=Talaromyces atroroseus TaxID=1441469 RepID=A0A225AQP5_TALAT|nr:Cytochrome b-c1 complex subunit 8 [Talaromyces atroroseus]OKL63941.1 Cytochrome b-c1 complex subunit 8 [Talaromyces atroroseus]